MAEDREAGVELEEVLQEAAGLIEASRFAEAFDLLRRQEEEYPESAVLLCTLGGVAEAAGAPGLAYEYYRRALAAEPEDPAVLITLGTELARYDDAEAERVLRLAVVLAPEVAEAHIAYGAYLAREGLTEQALPALERARTLAPEDPWAARELAVARLIAGDVARAIDTLEEAGELDAGATDAPLLLGLAQLQAGLGSDAAESLVRAAHELPQDGEAQALAALAASAEGW